MEGKRQAEDALAASPKKRHTDEGVGYADKPEGVRLGDGPQWSLLSRVKGVDRELVKHSSSETLIPQREDNGNPSGTMDQLVILQGLCGNLLEQALNCSELADVEFVFDDGESRLSGHRSVLCAVSQTYKGMFRAGMIEARTGKVPVRGISRRSFRGFLEWLYLGCGGEETAKADGRELWVLAELHDISSLRKWLLHACIDGKSVGPAMQFALEVPFGRKDVVTACLSYAALGLEDVQEDDMHRVGFHAARELLVAHMEDSVGKASVRAIRGFRFSRKWCDANRVSLLNREYECEGLVSLVDLGRMRSKDLERTVRPSGLVCVKDVEMLYQQRVRNETMGDAVFCVEQSYGSHGSGIGQFGASIRGVAVHGVGADQRIAACDRINHRVHVFNALTQQLMMTIGSEGKGDGEFVFPVGAAFSDDGHLYVSDMVLGRMSVFDREGQFVRTFARRGRGDGELQNPYGVAINSKGEVHVCDGWNNRIQKFAADGTYLRSYACKGSGQGQFMGPGGVAIGPEDSIVVADSGNSRVQILSEAGDFVRSFGSEGTGEGRFQTPSGVAVGTRGEILVTDRGRKDIQVFDWHGQYLQCIGNTGENSVELECPWGVAVGFDRCIFLGDIGCVHRMRDRE